MDDRFSLITSQRYNVNYDQNYSNYYELIITIMMFVLLSSISAITFYQLLEIAIDHTYYPVTCILMIKINEIITNKIVRSTVTKTIGNILLCNMI